MSLNQSILLVDSYPIIHQGVERLLSQSSEFNLVGHAFNVEECFSAFTTLNPDVVIADISLAGVGGVELIRRLKARNNDVKVIVYTHNDDSVHIRQSLSSGATSYVLKSSQTAELINAIKFSTLKRKSVVVN